MLEQLKERYRLYDEEATLVRKKASPADGLFGFGKKGGSGFRLVVEAPENEEFSLEIVTGMNSFLEVIGGKNGLVNPKRRRGNANFVWDFRPVEREHVAPLRTRWIRLSNGTDE